MVGDELIDHFLRHKGMKPHQCPVCEKSFLKLHKLNVHMRTHSDDKVGECDGAELILKFFRPLAQQFSLSRVRKEPVHQREFKAAPHQAHGYQGEN